MGSTEGELDHCGSHPLQDNLLYGPGQDTSTCSTQPQTDGLSELYQPVRGAKGEVIFSLSDPGAGRDTTTGFPTDDIVLRSVR